MESHWRWPDAWWVVIISGEVSADGARWVSTRPDELADISAGDGQTAASHMRISVSEAAAHFVIQAMPAPSTAARAPMFRSLSVIDCAKQTARGRLVRRGFWDVRRSHFGGYRLGHSVQKTVAHLQGEHDLFRLGGRSEMRPVIRSGADAMDKIFQA